MIANIGSSLPVVFALSWILVKLLLFTFNIPSQEKIGVFVNLFLLLFAGLASLHRKVVSEKKLEPYGPNFKFVLKNMGIYIILVTLYIFVHFKYINPGYLKAREEAKMEEILSQNFDKIKQNNIQWKDRTREEYIEQARGAAKALSSVTLNVSFYFLGLFVMAIIYSIFVPIFYKKVVLRM